MHARRSIICTVASGLTLGGCFSPQGPLINYGGAPHTYHSTEMQPKTVTIIDTRTMEEVWTMEIPPGKQLTFDFATDEGDDPVMRPDLMRWQVFDIGTRTGRLRNTVPVPGHGCRRVDVMLREGPEYQNAPPPQALRIDKQAEQPEWWSPKGGPPPTEDPAMTLYDE
jgi:hypothetical protein